MTDAIGKELPADLDKVTLQRAYARWAPVYDLVFGAVFDRGRRAAIAAADRVGGRILEVGVGTGISLPGYSSRNRIIGIDLSEAMLRKAQQRVAELSLTNVEKLEVMDAEHLSFPDASFDVVVANHVISTVPNPEAALDECARMLRPGGEMILLSRIGADAGLRHLVETMLQPIVRRLGWRTEFPWERFARWTERRTDVRLIERRPMPPFGHFSLLRFEKCANGLNVDRPADRDAPPTDGSLGHPSHLPETVVEKGDVQMSGFMQTLKVQRWDDHRYYHHSLVNQSLHLLSATSFVLTYFLLFWDPAMAALIGWMVSMTSRQIGHFFFEPKGYDSVNNATHEYKEQIKVGYNLRRKAVLLSIWALSPLPLYFEPTLFGMISPWESALGFVHQIGMCWLFIGVAGVILRSIQLFFIRDLQTGLVWAVKIMTDPFHDIKLYYKAPYHLMRGESRTSGAGP